MSTNTVRFAARFQALRSSLAHDFGASLVVFLVAVPLSEL